MKRRLCGSTATRVGCDGKAEECSRISFATLPSDTPRRAKVRQIWLAKIPRDNTPLTENSRVCSAHFPNNVRPDDKDEPPTIFVGKPVPVERTSRVSRGLIEKPSSSAAEVDEAMDTSDDAADVSGLVEHDYGHVPTLMGGEIDNLKERNLNLQRRLDQALEELQHTKDALDKCRHNYRFMKTDESKFLFYTGLSVTAFGHLLDIIKPAAMYMSYAADVPEDFAGQDPRGRPRVLCVEDELLLTLIKLRHDFPESDLAVRFGVAQATVSRIFSAYVRCMYFTFKDINIWPSRAMIDRFMPDSFKEKYPSTRVVIDATEFPTEKPANPDVQAATWSNYKGRNTFKLLVGVSPNGAVTFISPLYGGRTSDKELTKRSGLLDLLERNDTIMADRGFDIGSLMPEGTGLNIPPFLGSRDQLEAEEVVETRRIASIRIHVERAMERIKNFCITKFIPAVLCPIAEHIIYVCTFLTLFMEPLVPPPSPSAAPSSSVSHVHTGPGEAGQAASSATPAVTTAPLKSHTTAVVTADQPMGTAVGPAASFTLDDFVASAGAKSSSSLSSAAAASTSPHSITAFSDPFLAATDFGMAHSTAGEPAPCCCFVCGMSDHRVLRTCKACQKQYHHMCQVADEEGRLCNACHDSYV